MRISTLSYMNSSLPGILNNQSQIARLNQQIASGQQYNSAKDNPLAAQQALDLSSSIAIDTQYVANQTSANQTLSEGSTVLQGMQAALQGASTLLTTASAGDSQAVRSQNAANLQNFYKQIKDFANSQDSSGNFLFAGNNVKTQPYLSTPVYPAIAASTPMTYTGTPDGAQLSSQGVRSVGIDKNSSIQVSDNLQNVLQFASPVNIPYSKPVVPATTPPTYTSTNVSTTDVFQAIDQLSIALSDPNLPGGQLQKAMNDTTNALNAALQNLQTVQSRVAVAQVQIKDTQTNTQNRLSNHQNALSDLTLADKATAAVSMQTYLTSLQAAESAFSQTAKLSIFNYL